ncbi:hypothetical protein GOODEAATRI_019906 [Goodea atripinnis]|uniref:Uncharacterized protein n=1 Tax=Goodea atripinnis TaxID=208336 RepID=A0ABV0PZH8_9TELE
MLLPVVLGLLKGLDPALGDPHLRKHCHRITHVSTLLLNILTYTLPACASLLLYLCLLEGITLCSFNQGYIRGDLKEDRDSPLTGSDVPPQGARSDRTRSAV